MSSKATLKAQKRDAAGKGAARALRREGRVPAVLYGRDLESMNLSVDARDAEYLFHSISVDNTIVDLAVEGEKKSYQTLVREIQTHPWKESLLHIDFLRIQEGVEVDLDVPVHLVGVPVGVRLEGGVLEQTIHDIPVRCVPSNIPELFELDVTDLDLNDSLHVSDIVLGEGVELRISEDLTICSVAVPRVSEEPELEAAEPVEGEEEAEEEGEEEAGGPEAEADENGGEED